ncbi:hypothetical protein [Streptomyces mirabilis]|uniref:hypothetical protein n=1 Tax=Streptomyces mirabilis TaxID=68239 RepID=UPI0022597A41|nr:hypothetical protein [Streptomyces mirabilis]MCX4423559.1 hypothetical protein [Streptomyces mirabilis]
MGTGAWPAIIDRGQWDEAQRFREYRAAQAKGKQNRPTRAKLEELKQLFLTDDDFTTAEFHAMRAVVLKRMKERQRKTVKRPIAVLEGIAGPDAESNWERLEKEEDYARMNAIYRFLFAAVVLRPPTRKGRGCDTERVDIKPNPLD